MFFNKHHDKLHLQTKSVNSISSRWKFVIGTMIGSGTGLVILLMWTSGSIDGKSSCDGSSSPNSTVDLHGRMAIVGSDSEPKSSAYCKSTDCKTVSCSSISGSLNPGQFTSDYLSTTFLRATADEKELFIILCRQTELQAQCPHADTLEVLEFQSCTFPNNKLGIDWLTTNLPVEKLSFRDCPLEDFPKGSFGSSIFANLQVLHVIAANIRVLRKCTFDELKNLIKLSFEDNTVHEADANLLSSVANSLEILELDGCLADVEVLANITSLVVLPKLTILSIQRNRLDRISGQLFKSIPNIVSMYLVQSNIATIDVDTLKYTRRLGLLDLKNNMLTSIAAGTLTPVLSGRPDFKLSIAGNPWDCSCEFEWIKYLIRDHPGMMTDIPKCETPDRNALLFFTAAEFCDNSRPASTTLQSPTTSTSIVKTTRNNETNEDDETIRNYVKFTCRKFERHGITGSTRELLSTEEWKFPSRFHGFYVRSLENGDVLVSLKKPQASNVSLIWFRNIEIGRSNDSSERIDCLRNVNDSFILRNLSSDSSYTICLLENLAELPSPLNCLAARTRANYTLEKNNVWLTNEDKSVVIPIGISLFVVVSLLSAVTSFWLIRKNPSLLRGSKRIVMVKKRDVDALVMPKGTNWNSSTKDNSSRRIANDNKGWSNERCLKKNSEMNCLNPLKNRKAPIDRKTSSPPIVARRKDSKVSRVSSLYSGGSYISAIEATPSELYNWRHTTRMKSCYSTCLEDDEFETPSIPSLPPHRPIDPPIPSLSLALQSDKCPHIFHQIYNDQRIS